MASANRFASAGLRPTLMRVLQAKYHTADTLSHPAAYLDYGHDLFKDRRVSLRFRPALISVDVPRYGIERPQAVRRGLSNELMT